MIEPLRVAIVAVDTPRAASLMREAEELGHEVARGEATPESIRLNRPDVLLIGRAAGDDECLSWISRASQDFECAAILVLNLLDGGFIQDAAARGAFAYVAHSGIAALNAALCIASFRHHDRLRLLDAFDRRAVIEQAKGILMASNRISSDRAFTLLRRQSQRTNKKIVEIAQAVIHSHSLLVPSPDGMTAREDEQTIDTLLATLVPGARAR